MAAGTIRYSADEEPVLNQIAVQQTTARISAVSFEDEEWWLDLRGQDYLRAHADALKKGIMIERIFLVPFDKQAALKDTFQHHLDLGIEAFVLTPDEVNELHRRDFVVYDDLLLRTGQVTRRRPGRSEGCGLHRR